MEELVWTMERANTHVLPEEATVMLFPHQGFLAHFIEVGA